METLKDLQKTFKDKLAKLDDFRNIEYEKRTTEDRKERDISTGGTLKTPVDRQESIAGMLGVGGWYPSGD